MNQYEVSQSGAAVGDLGVSVRAQFVSRTYAHLTAAVALFTLIEVALFRSGAALNIAVALTSTSWLLVLGGFVGLGWLASWAAIRATSLAAQYAALGGYVVLNAIIFVPLLFAANQSAPGTISSAAVVTLIGFSALTAVVFLTRADFSWLRGLLIWAGILSLVAIVGAVIFKFNLGTWFSIAMITLAGGAVLYDTSNVLRSYPPDRYVAAALQLFSSVAMMFWYVLRLFLGGRR